MKLAPIYRYNPTITSLKARVVAENLRANEQFDPNVAGPIYEYLMHHEATESLSDDIAIYTIAYIVPETSLTVDDVLGFESWEQLINKILAFYLDIPERRLFQKTDVSERVNKFEVVANNDSPTMSVGEPEMFEPQTYETEVIDILRVGSQMEIGTRECSIRERADLFKHNIIKAVYSELPSVESSVENSVRSVTELIDQVIDAGYNPNMAIVGNQTSLYNHQWDGLDSELDSWEYSNLLGNGEIIICDKDHFGYEIQAKGLSSKSFDNPLSMYRYRYPVTVISQIRGNWAGVNTDAITRGIVSMRESRARR